MRILWVSMNSSLYDAKKSICYNGGGWIGSIFEQLKTTNLIDLELGVTFLYDYNFKDRIDGVYYYGIKSKKPSGIKKWLYYQNGYKSLNHLDYYDELLSVIDDFKPDVIHLWGVENNLASIVHYKGVPVVAHLQGLLSLYIYIYYPYGTNSHSFRLDRFSKREWILNNGFIFGERIMKHRAEIEKKHLKAVSAVMGRTDWDKKVALFNNPDVKYYHVDEILRQPFYSAPIWNKPRTKKFIIYSTISETIYKGLDVIMKAAAVLKEYGYFDFEWRIAGVKLNSEYVRWVETITGLKCTDININCVGIQNPDLLIQGLLNADLYVHPSYIDNSPNSLCEAQYLGVPCCATDVGGVSSLIHDRVSGVLFPSNAPFDMAMAVKDCYDNEHIWREYAAQGKVDAQNRHNQNTIIQKLLTVYNELKFRQ